MTAKKYLPLIYIVLLSIATMTGMITPKNNTSATETDVQVIPNEAIRLRILANSNKDTDQELKRSIRDEVNKEINKWVAELTSIEEARKVISSNLPEIEAIAKDVMIREGNVQKIQVDFGETVFPTKLYGQYLYPAGKYEAIKITLGEGEGENWWCVLFPPLCFLDFNSGTAVASASVTEEESAIEDVPVNSSISEETVEQTQSNEDKLQPIETASQTDQPVEKAEDQGTQQEFENQPEEAEQEINAPVYEDSDEEPVKVKFFLKEVLKDLF